jgi:hypothetical protein
VSLPDDGAAPAETSVAVAPRNERGPAVEPSLPIVAGAQTETDGLFVKLNHCRKIAATAESGAYLGALCVCRAARGEICLANSRFVNENETGVPALFPRICWEIG